MGVSLGLTLKELTMAHANSAQFTEAPVFSFKPLMAIRNYILLLASAFSEAKILEQKSRKHSGNW